MFVGGWERKYVSRGRGKAPFPFPLLTYLLSRTPTINHQQEQTPSYLPSYTRLGHAIPGSKTVSVGDWCLSVYARARLTQTTNTLPPLYRQINREDRLVVREGVCVLGRKGRRRLSYLHTHLPP